MIFLCLLLILYRDHALGKLSLDSNNNVLPEVPKASAKNNTIASGIQMNSSNVSPEEEIAELRKVNKSLCAERSEENKKHNEIAAENRALKDENEKLRNIIETLKKEKAELEGVNTNLEEIPKEQLDIDEKEFDEDILEYGGV